jgi:hypothetical protein
MASKRTDSRTLRWKTDFDKNVVVTNFERRGWLKTEGICKHIIVYVHCCSSSTVLHHKLHATCFARRDFLVELVCSSSALHALQATTGTSTGPMSSVSKQ